MARVPPVVRLGHAGSMHAPVSLLVAGVVFGVLTLRILHESSQFSAAAHAPGGAVLLLSTTWLCVLAGAAQLWHGHQPRRAAVLLGLAGLSWLVPDWANPDAPAGLYAAALLFGSVTPALLLHSVLAGRDHRRRARAAEGVMVLSGYVLCFGVLGLAPATVFDPTSQGCNSCPANPWLIRDAGAMVEALERMGALALGVWLAAAAGLLAREALTRAGLPRRKAIQVPALGFLATLAVQEIADLTWGIPNRSTLSGALWFITSLALACAALGALWTILARHRTRRSLGHMLIDLARGQQPGLLRDAFAERLADPTLELLYSASDGTLVDALGRAASPAETSDRRSTALHHRGAPLGLIVHSTATPMTSMELQELVATTHLGLEHEGLTARALSEESDLRASGVRILSARATERKRLERDLHDGAQQRLVGMALGLQLLHRNCPGPDTEAALAHLQRAIEELRAIAQGLSPPVLADAGLKAALKSLSETRDLRLSADHLRRIDPTTEATAYQLVEAATRDARSRVHLATRGGALRIAATVTGEVGELATAADRVTALGGHVAIRHEDDATHVEVQLPLDAATC